MRLRNKRAPWGWTEECQAAFEDLKHMLTTAPVLQPPDFNLPFKVQTGTSEIGLVAVLTQENQEGENVIAYASHLLH